MQEKSSFWNIVWKVFEKSYRSKYSYTLWFINEDFNEDGRHWKPEKIKWFPFCMYRGETILLINTILRDDVRRGYQNISPREEDAYR